MSQFRPTMFLVIIPPTMTFAVTGGWIQHPLSCLNILVLSGYSNKPRQLYRGIFTGYRLAK